MRVGIHTIFSVCVLSFCFVFFPFLSPKVTTLSPEVSECEMHSQPAIEC